MGACSCAVKMDFPKQHGKLEPEVPEWTCSPRWGCKGEKG